MYLGFSSLRLMDLGTISDICQRPMSYLGRTNNCRLLFDVVWSLSIVFVAYIFRFDLSRIPCYSFAWLFRWRAQTLGDPATLGIESKICTTNLIRRTLWKKGIKCTTYGMDSGKNLNDDWPFGWDHCHDTYWALVSSLNVIA